MGVDADHVSGVGALSGSRPERRNSAQRVPGISENPSRYGVADNTVDEDAARRQWLSERSGKNCAKGAG
jgi:hypothetical protein